MKVLYISYWSINDPLTISSVMPTLKALRTFLGADRLTLTTVERKDANYPPYTIPFDFVDHVAITPKAQWNSLATKAYEMLVMPREIESVCRARQIDLIFARGSLAGTIACKVHERTKIPYIVESFEPHSEYMAQLGAWARDSWKYRYARKFELRQMQSARMLITVAHSYRDHLVAKEGVDPTRVAVVPCVVDLEEARFDSEQRHRIRKRLGLGDAITAIYAGKFGGLYYEEEAFRVMRDAFDFFPDFRVVLLTPVARESILAHLDAQGIPRDRVHVQLVPRHEVPAYLSAADFAYSFHRPNPAALFLCPIKHGEYWACGLPFVVPRGVGDDSAVIEKEGGGALLDSSLSNIRACHEAIGRIIAAPGSRASVGQLAVRYKGEGIIADVLSRAFGRVY
jgi:hypothetical protein